MSITILGVYLGMNMLFYPGYPVINSFADKSTAYEEHYPPFRLNEWRIYTVTESIIYDNLRTTGESPKFESIGFPLLATLLTYRFGEMGIYYTNAFIMWLSALVFFLLMRRFAPFYLAVAGTFVLAFATPNLFFASSAYSEPLAQLLLLISLYFLMKGISAEVPNLFYFLCGLACGLKLFILPVKFLTVLLFLFIVLGNDRERRARLRGAGFLLGGYATSLLMFIAVSGMLFGRLPNGVFSLSTSMYSNLSSIQSARQVVNPIVGIWKHLFDSPHGLVFIMPVTTVVPLGIIAMWRKSLKSPAIVAGALILCELFWVAMMCYPDTGESVGSRQMLPVIPLLILPLAFVWQRGAGEKAWIGATLLMTVYMCTFGWWTGVVREEGLFIGVLHDRNARYILLARKERLERPAFKSTREIEDMFFASLKERDIKKWLQTLARTSIRDIQGFEREVFYDQANKVMNESIPRDQLIASINPDGGIRLAMPEIKYDFGEENTP